MSKSKRLPIYRVGYQLLSLVTDLVRNFSRDFRPTLGHRLQGESVALVLQVYRANAAISKRMMMHGHPVDAKFTRAFAQTRQEP